MVALHHGTARKSHCSVQGDYHIDMEREVREREFQMFNMAYHITHGRRNT